MEPSIRNGGVIAWSAHQLFERYFRPLYPADLREHPTALVAARAADANPGDNPRLYRELSDAADIFARLAPAALFREDLVLDRSDASVHRLATAITSESRARLIEASPAGDPNGIFPKLVIHGALYTGACVVASHAGRWGVRRPLWESVVRLRSRAGDATLAPFHWWLKAWSDAEVDRGGLATRYRQHVERATARPEDLPPIFGRVHDRPLTTLRVVRYDLLHKYLRANLPELKDLGRDFPTAEEFDDIKFLTLDFLVLGEGRVLLMHGRGRAGLHLFWLDHQGFSHAMFFPAEPGDPHAVEVEGDRLIVRFVGRGTESGQSIDQVHELLWWG